MNTARFLLSWFQPTVCAFSPFLHLPFDIRWRLLLLQSIAILANGPKYIYWLAHRVWCKDHIVIDIPVRDGSRLRALIFWPPEPPSSSATQSLRPLHLDIHGGAFLGGCPEYDAPLCSFLASKTGCVVVTTTYRCAPGHYFPTPVQDVEDVILWLHAHAAETLEADPSVLTLSGCSAGGALAFSAAQAFAGTNRAVKGIASLYAPLDLRRPPWEKRKPPGFPKRDPLAVLMPLFDLYASTGRREYGCEDPRLSPVIADPEKLPDEILMVVPTMDILVEEQLVFAERLRGVKGTRVEVKLMEGRVHGFDDLPWFIADQKLVAEAYDAVASFIRRLHAPSTE